MWKAYLVLLIYTLLHKISLLIQHHQELKLEQVKEIKEEFTGVNLINKILCKLSQEIITCVFMHMLLLLLLLQSQKLLKLFKTLHMMVKYLQCLSIVIHINITFLTLFLKMQME
jgi:hypothetical protein